MGEMRWRQGHTRSWQVAQCFGEQEGIAGANSGPLRQALELDATDGALELGEAEIGAKAFVQPAEAGWMLAPMASP